MKITQKELKELVVYDPETGLLFWKPRELKWFTNEGKRSQEDIQKQWNNRYAWEQAFAIKQENGYLIGGLFKQNFYTHRVIWFYMTGEWPKHDIDHINGIRNDNRWSNLREATRSENLKNQKKRFDNKTGQTGVHFRKNKNDYIAFIHANGKRIHLCVTSSFDEACRVRKQAEIDYNYHENHGRVMNDS